MKKKISVVLLLIIVVTCGLTLIGCERQRKVEIVLYHPITGEEIGDVSLIEFEEGEIPEKTKVKFAIRDIKNGKLLTDEDLEPYSSLETCCRITFNKSLESGSVSLKDNEHWPTGNGEYRLYLKFTSVDNTVGNYERRYATAWGDYDIEIGV